MMRFRWLPLCLAAVIACGGSEEQDERSEPAAGAVILEPTDGAVLTGPDVHVIMTAHGIEIVPAGENRPNSGHLHLFLDRDITPVGEVIPTEEGIVHFGLAQTEHTFEELEPGQHTIVAVLGDWTHVRMPVVTDTVRVTVQP